MAGGVFSDAVKSQAAPVKVTLLAEDFVLFRDGEGNLGLVALHCSHRGTSLEYGRVEKNGIRCCYHGWLWDVRGNCLEQPAEPADSTFKNAGQASGLLCAGCRRLGLRLHWSRACAAFAEL